MRVRLRACRVEMQTRFHLGAERGAHNRHRRTPDTYCLQPLRLVYKQAVKTILKTFFLNIK
jgi:hypothetical protein